jgi:hypothetical protein
VVVEDAGRPRMRQDVRVALSGAKLGI